MTKNNTKTKDTVKKEMKIIDASGRALGRVASEVAMSLMGKTSPAFKRNVYSGMPVKVLNAGQIRTTSRKLAEIEHKRYSGYPGGLRVISGTEMAEKKGMGELVRLAVYQMLPDNKLRREMMKHLKIEN